MFTFQGPIAPREVLYGVRAGKLTSFCLFKGINIISPDQLRTLCESLYAAAREGGQPPPLIGTDQEGGQLIAVVGGATELPGQMALGATRNADLAQRAGQLVARELLAMGVNMNFAPVLDINNNPNNPSIGVRSFGDDAALVADLGVAMIRGMQAEGVVATAKHFLGSGDITTDTHFQAARVTHPRSRLEAVELAPFRAAVREKVGAIMSAHVIFEALDPHNPATLSQAVLTDLLRTQLGYTGLILTDAMDMHAVSVRGAVESVAQSLRAGADLALLGHLPDQFGIMSQIEQLNLDDGGSSARIAAARAALPKALLDPSIIGCAEHQALAQEIADQAITLVRDSMRLPLHMRRDEQIAVITPAPVNLTPADTSADVSIGLAEAIRRRWPGTVDFQLPQNSQAADVVAVLAAVREFQYVIVGTISVERDPNQGMLVRALLERGQQPIVIAMRTPYDLHAFPGIGTYLCSYSIREVAMEAVARVLFGEIQPRGSLPCAI
jgi:beta-N-acetylhexosaminidase